MVAEPYDKGSSTTICMEEATLSWVSVTDLQRV